MYICWIEGPCGGILVMEAYWGYWQHLRDMRGINSYGDAEVVAGQGRADVGYVLAWINI